MNRGGYKHLDDPGLQFKLDEPELIKALSSKSIFDLHIGEQSTLTFFNITIVFTLIVIFQYFFSLQYYFKS